MPSALPDTEIAVPRSVGRVLDLLETVLVDGPCSLTAASAQVGLTPTTALRHLRALEARGYLDRDGSGIFDAGPVMLRLAASLCESKELDRLIAAAQPVLTKLAGTTGESTYLAVSDGRQATYIATAESDRAIRHVGWVGRVIPLDDTAIGEALASPGSVAFRVGAVEPDVTAISLSPGNHNKLGIAISVIGPSHRLDHSVVTTVGKSLKTAVAELGRILGLNVDGVKL